MKIIMMIFFVFFSFLSCRSHECRDPFYNKTGYDPFLRTINEKNKREFKLMDLKLGTLLTLLNRAPKIKPGKNFKLYKELVSYPSKIQTKEFTVELLSPSVSAVFNTSSYKHLIPYCYSYGIANLSIKFNKIVDEFEVLQIFLTGRLSDSELLSVYKNKKFKDGIFDYIPEETYTMNKSPDNLRINFKIDRVPRWFPEKEMPDGGGFKNIGFTIKFKINKKSYALHIPVTNYKITRRPGCYKKLMEFQYKYHRALLDNYFFNH
ncbi:MAG: hypothetical protein JXR95_01165 [Deltaproteobacteria bacterium]|nr:hypothetical protein [Deltaproteobacteria bacterium]